MHSHSHIHAFMNSSHTHSQVHVLALPTFTFSHLLTLLILTFSHTCIHTPHTHMHTRTNTQKLQTRCPPSCHTCSGSSGRTNSDGVDGVGIAVVVAVVVVLTPIAAGHHKDAPKTLPACDHPMLQCSLESREIHLRLQKNLPSASSPSKRKSL